MNNLASIISEGREASNAHLDLISNPYTPGSDESAAWLRGWFGGQIAWLGTSQASPAVIRLPDQPVIKAA